jgi:hypothetical protein
LRELGSWIIATATTFAPRNWSGCADGDFHDETKLVEVEAHAAAAKHANAKRTLVVRIIGFLH